MVPLHVHSFYTLMKGTLSIEKLIENAKKYNLKSLALTDSNGMYGLIKFYKLAEENNIKPILGSFIDDPNDPSLNAVLLAKNFEGYSKLCKIITRRQLDEEFSLINILSSETENLFILTSSLKLLQSLQPHDNIYAELIVTSNLKKQTRQLYNYAVQNNINFTASHPVYFSVKDDYEVHKLITAIRLNKRFEDLTNEELVDEEFYFKDPEELKKIWKSLPGALAASDFIAGNCNVDLQIGKYKFPKFELPEGITAQDVLRQAAEEGLKIRYKPVTEAAVERMEFELDIINDMNFADYFLIVLDIVREAKRRGMMLIGRGSAANSIISYLLGFTNVDPVKYKLYFERFLNRSRSNPPDIDLDFSWKERDEIIKYIFERYGYENVAMISTHVTFRARSAFRETAKAFGFTTGEASKYSKRIPWTDAANLPNISELFPETKDMNFKIEPWKSIVDRAVKIANFPRHLSIHPSGIIITPKPVTNFTALEFAKNKGLGLIITQPDMYGVEDLGLIKIDILSQRSLGVLRDTLNMIEDNFKNDS
jgi:DNA polymerase III alpha subunit